MCRLEAVKGDDIVFAFDIHSELFVCMFNHFIGTIIWLLQWLANCVVSHKVVCAGGQIITDMHFSLRLVADWDSLQLLHSCYELSNIVCWVKYHCFLWSQRIHQVDTGMSHTPALQHCDEYRSSVQYECPVGPWGESPSNELGWDLRDSLADGGIIQ